MTHAFGRIVEHDPASRAFAFAAPAKLVRKTTRWAHHAPVLNQGNLGSCTGNALAQCLNADYFNALRLAVNKGQPFLEADAVALYSAATHLDHAPGHYPPTDTGSSGLAVCKAGKAAGYLASYRHAFSFTSFLAALQTQPLIVGTSFYADMENPNRAGLVRPTGGVVGGHEYLCLGVDYGADLLTFLNSWSANWGVAGRFSMHLADFAALLADHGDVSVPIALGHG